MTDHLIEGFHRRRNEDGTFTSICPRCFLTAAFTHDESQLGALELEHVCDPEEQCFISLIDPARLASDVRSA